MIRRPLLLALVVVASALPLAAQGESEQEIDTCLACHGDNTMSLDLPDGGKVSLHVDKAGFEQSIHAALKCTDCHQGFGEIPHPDRQVKSAAEFSAGFREVCKQCHFDKYTQSFDGVHYKMLAKGNTAAPTCLDCHGSHGITAASKPRTRISETCSVCHYEIYEVYSKSVHGRALVEAQNEDVPVCTDCHRSHDIPDPRGQGWLVRTPEICGKCHSDAKMMAKYGLSTSVLQTYLADFHGTTSALSGARSSDATGAPRVTALCIDCHGVHDIAKVADPESKVLKANLVKTCRKCHPGASDTFPSAWLSHYEPSWSKAPLVYGVKVAYAFLIPFMIGGLCLQILLHLWRVVVNR